MKVCYILIILSRFVNVSIAYPAAQNLFDDLFRNSHKFPKTLPILNVDAPVVIYMNLSLSQILEVDVKNQIIKLNVWVYQEWKDKRFTWNPDHYGGLSEIQIPSNMVWLPDLVLYNNAGDEWDLSEMSKSKLKVRYDGSVFWRPPVILKSQCDMDVTYFPFDTQSCFLKMGTWTHNGFLIDLRHLIQKNSDIENNRIKFDFCQSKIDYAIDISNYLQNYEWDLLELNAYRNIKKYPCCPEPYIDVTFHIKIRRKILFYGLNLIFPCISISFLTIMVFFLPAFSTQKMTLCISVFLALSLFILVVFDLTPSTSRSVPIIVKYLLFTMFMVSLSIAASLFVLTLSFRQPAINRLSKMTRNIFLKTLPPYFKLAPMKFEEKEYNISYANKSGINTPENVMSTKNWLKLSEHFSKLVANEDCGDEKISKARRRLALESLRLIKHNLLLKSERSEVHNEWIYMRIVIDRLFLLIFTIMVALGTIVVFLMSPRLSDRERILTSKDSIQLMKNSNYTRLCS